MNDCLHKMTKNRGGVLSLGALGSIRDFLGSYYDIKGLLLTTSRGLTRINAPLGCVTMYFLVSRVA